jgi:integrase
VALWIIRGRQAVERTDAAERWVEHGLVFPSTIGTPMEPRNLNRHFEQLRAELDMPGVRLHDLRHTMVSLLLDLHVPPHTGAGVGPSRRCGSSP